MNLIDDNNALLSPEFDLAIQQVIQGNSVALEPFHIVRQPYSYRWTWSFVEGEELISRFFMTESGQWFSGYRVVEASASAGIRTLTKSLIRIRAYCDLDASHRPPGFLQARRSIHEAWEGALTEDWRN